MIVVIQCAASKRATAGHMISSDGRPVRFVANPQVAPKGPNWIYARPDDRAHDGRTWRHLVVDYDNNPSNNPLGLYPAFELYERDVYRRLVDKLGLDKVYILSAGWGLIRSSFLTPLYDITFSASVEPYKRRLKTDGYSDFQMLPSDAEEQILFLGGKDYVPLFCQLTACVRSTPIVFYNSTKPPRAKRCELWRFETMTRTNWHYECAQAVIDGAVAI